MSQSTESTNETNPFTKPGYIIAAALVVALIAATIVIFLVIPDGSEEGTPQPAQSSTSAAVATTTAAAAGKSICGLPGSSDKALGSAPKTDWELVGKMAAPTAADFGPGKKDSNGFRYCFANSPEGALFAAVNVAVLGSSGRQDLQVELAEKLLVPGTGRDTAMKKAVNSTGSSGNGTTVQVEGFVVKPTPLPKPPSTWPL